MIIKKHKTIHKIKLIGREAFNDNITGKVVFSDE